MRKTSAPARSTRKVVKQVADVREQKPEPVNTFARSTMQPRFAIGILENRVLLRVPQDHLSLAEATAYAETYNRLERDRQAVILLHPISRAICSKQSAAKDD